MKKSRLWLMLVLSGIPLWADRLVVEDFADAGTWRQAGAWNATLGTWFSADQCLSGVPAPSREDGFAGRLIYDLVPGKNGRLEFLRAKAAQAEVFADVITFSANTGGVSCRIGFVVQDVNGKNFATSLIDIGSPGWNDYRLPLDRTTIKEFTRIAFPVRMMRVVFVAVKGGKGSILIDDLAFGGTVGKKYQLKIFPVLARLDFPPEQRFSVDYRLSNAASRDVSGRLSVVLRDFQEREVYRGAVEVTLPSLGRKVYRLEFPALPIGSYHAALKLEGGGSEAVYIDWLNVFKSNDGRLNRRKMWFGIQDTDIWNGEYERRLHGEWLKTLGVDLVRFGITGNRMDNGDFGGLAGLGAMLEALRQNNLLVCLSYCEGSPAYVRTSSDHRSIPDKMPEFKVHLRKIFTFLKQYSNVRYLEWWNEPDIGFLRSGFAEYLASMKVLYGVAKSIAPEILIATGGVTVIHPKEKKNFSRDMYQQGKGFYDVACFHAHGSLGNYVVRNEQVETWLGAAGQKVPMCNTETGERSGYNVDTIKRQAEVLVKKITYAKSRNTDFYIWFTIQDYWDMDFNADDSFGLVTSDNRAKPSYAAYNELIRQLANTERGEKINIIGEIDSYRFVNRDAGEEVLVCWPVLAGVRSSFALRGKGAVEIGDLFGRRQRLDGSGGLVMIPVMTSPCYVRYPVDAFRPIASPISRAGVAAGAAGGTAVIRLKLRNVFAQPAVFELKSAGTAMLKAEVPVGQEKMVAVTVPIPAGSRNGVMSFDFNCTIIAGEQRLVQSLPVSVNVCYPVNRSGNKPERIVIDSLAQVNELSFDPAIPKWNGPKDLAASLEAVSDGKLLAFDVLVNDDRHILTHSPAEAWRDDSLQLGLANLQGGCTYLTISGKDGKGTVWCHEGIRRGLAGAWKCPASVVHVDGKTIYRFKLPLADLGIGGTAGTAFRFAFLVNENDGQGRVRWIEWNSGIGRSKNPDEFGWGVIK